MFDISFAELMVIGIVMLLVIGPEKLPKVARTVGAYAGRMQRFMAQVKDEVNRETRFEELQKLQQEVKSSILHTESSILDHSAQLKQEVTAWADATAEPVASVEAENIALTQDHSSLPVQSKRRSAVAKVNTLTDAAGAVETHPPRAAHKTQAIKAKSIKSKPIKPKPSKDLG